MIFQSSAYLTSIFSTDRDETSSVLRALQPWFSYLTGIRATNQTILGWKRSHMLAENFSSAEFEPRPHCIINTKYYVSDRVTMGRDTRTTLIYIILLMYCLFTTCGLNSSILISDALEDICIYVCTYICMNAFRHCLYHRLLNLCFVHVPFLSFTSHKNV